MKKDYVPFVSEVEEFNDDLRRIKYIKRLFNQYDMDGVLKERLILMQNAAPTLRRRLLGSTLAVTIGTAAIFATASIDDRLFNFYYPAPSAGHNVCTNRHTEIKSIFTGLEVAKTRAITLSEFETLARRVRQYIQ